MNFSYIVDRLKEPSSWAGLAAIVTGVTGLTFSADLTTQITTAGVGVAGLIAFLLKEKGVSK